ncbi:TetR/AcrR family transcriptional regulator [Pseudomonas sp. 273]|uniref:TetR/AcrR family transcriptional regulator n=1 Tax=Pseudomonas sp. 273 TaxID=75692 RepID=UPI0023D83883|nr:TetR/AcrR family transcriptional regulator [Pseudomonas sp. 273]
MANKSVRYENMPLRQSAILDAAAEAFSRIGYEATSIDYVADQIQATKGSVYYYYRSKGTCSPLCTGGPWK